MRRHIDPDGSVAVRENFQQFVDASSRTSVRSRAAGSYRLRLDIARTSGSLSFSNSRVFSGFLQTARNYTFPDSRFRQDARSLQGPWLSALPTPTPSRDSTTDW